MATISGISVGFDLPLPAAAAKQAPAAGRESLDTTSQNPVTAQHAPRNGVTAKTRNDPAAPRSGPTPEEDRMLNGNGEPATSTTAPEAEGKLGGILDITEEFARTGLAAKPAAEYEAAAARMESRRLGDVIAIATHRLSERRVDESRPGTEEARQAAGAEEEEPSYIEETEAKRLERAQEHSEDRVEQAIEHMNETMRSFQRDVSFKVHNNDGEQYVEVYDRNTDRVIRRLPPENLLQKISRIERDLGYVVDKEG